MHAESAWIPLELDETVTAAADNNFASCNPTNLKAHDNSFVQRNNFTNMHNKNLFQNQKKESNRKK